MRTTCTWTERPYEALLFPGIGFGPFLRHLFESSSRKYEEHSSIPPRGWNSYDSFCWTVSEEEFLQSSEVVAEKLHKYGYEVSAYVESGRICRVKDRGQKERACAWMSHGLMSINTNTGARKAFLKSLYHQYAEWGVDFGTSVTPEMAKDVSGLINMYRITGDDWDSLGDVAAHFDVSRDFSTANMIGASGLLGKSWPDLDMLPLGNPTDPVYIHFWGKCSGV